MSKTLAAINTDCGYVAGYSKGDCGSYVSTKPPTSGFKRLEFKNILNRFGGDVQVHDDVAGKVTIVYELADTRKFLIRRLNAKVWVSIIYPSRAAKVYRFALSEKEIYFIRCHGFADKGLPCRRSPGAAVKKPKGRIFEFEASCGTVWADRTRTSLDASVAAYLLNPLKDSYDYDDIARDYLGLTVPSKNRFVWKRGTASR